MVLHGSQPYLKAMIRLALFLYVVKSTELQFWLLIHLYCSNSHIQTYKWLLERSLRLIHQLTLIILVVY